MVNNLIDWTNEKFIPYYLNPRHYGHHQFLGYWHLPFNTEDILLLDMLKLKPPQSISYDLIANKKLLI